MEKGIQKKSKEERYNKTENRTSLGRIKIKELIISVDNTRGKSNLKLL